jgi:hypothetical protein
VLSIAVDVDERAREPSFSPDVRGSVRDDRSKTHR